MIQGCRSDDITFLPTLSIWNFATSRFNFNSELYHYAKTTRVINLNIPGGYQGEVNFVMFNQPIYISSLDQYFCLIGLDIITQYTSIIYIDINYLKNKF